MSNYPTKILICMCGILLCARIAFGQDEAAQLRLREEYRQQEYEDSIALEKEKKGPDGKKLLDLKYGGWVTSYLTSYRNLDNDDDVEEWIEQDYYLDTRVWVNTVYDRTFSCYARMRDYYIWRPEVASDYTGIGDDNKGPTIDALYLEANLYPVYRIPLSARVGRQFLTIGRGITYANTHDGVQVKMSLGKKALIKAFVSNTQPLENNIDYSVPGYSKKANDRQFYGVEATLYGKDVALYAYTLAQRDNSRESPERSYQNYTYDSEYIGIGISGNASPSLSYWGEVIKEYGSSYTDARLTELAVKEVDAWALDTGAKYRFDIYSHPIVEGEFAYGSGDPDRTSVTNTIGSDIEGRDTNFLYFGVFEAGYALYPRLSNILMYKAGIAFTPMEFISCIGKNIAIGSRFYVYRKDEAQGGIYDVEATENSRDVGKELDLFLHWKVYENFFLTFRYGVFFPGHAYPEGTRDNSEYTYLQARFLF